MPPRPNVLWVMCDLMPTVAELAGVPVDHRIDGRSVAPALREGDEPPEQSVFAEICTWDGLKFGTDGGDCASYRSRDVCMV